MKMGLIIFLGLFSLEIQASFSISPGIGYTSPTETKEMNEVGKKLVNFKYALGIDLDFEWAFWKSLSVNIGGSWRGGGSIVQYSYTDRNNPLETASVKDLDARASNLTGHIGGRLRFINLKYFDTYLGAGLTKGRQYLSYDKEKFELISGSTVGLKESENRNFQGHYLEIGLEFLSSEGGSLRISGRQSKYQTEKFETLGERALTVPNLLFSIQYVHPIK